MVLSGSRNVLVVLCCSHWFSVVLSGSRRFLSFTRRFSIVLSGSRSSRRFSVVLIDSQWFSVVLVGSRRF